MLVRITNMRGVDLNLFDFDYDLVWAAFFMNAEEQIYGRYGGRNAASADKYLSLTGLKYAMQQALAAHRRTSLATTEATNALRRTLDDYPATRRLKANACIHCHQAYDFPREVALANGRWRRNEVWVYPLPQNLGLTLEVDRGNRVQTVAPGSSAARAGLQAGDILSAIDGRPIASIADVQFALHRAPAQGHITVDWTRARQPQSAELELGEGWRETDLSWRASVRRIGPPPCVHGEDLSTEEKIALGLKPQQLAFRQGNFVSAAARQAGIRQKDIILGIDDWMPEMTVAQFRVYLRLNYRPGDRVMFHVLRDDLEKGTPPLKREGLSPLSGKIRIRLPLTLPSPEKGI